MKTLYQLFTLHKQDIPTGIFSLSGSGIERPCDITQHNLFSTPGCGNTSVGLVAHVLALEVCRLQAQIDAVKAAVNESKA